MSFQTKAFASIAASIINHARAVQSGVTDFTPGSVIRTMLESPAIDIEQLYIQFFNALIEAIPTSIYTAFGFGIQPAQSATGLLDVVITAAAQPTLIPAGTVFQVTGAAGKYVTPIDVTIAAGDTIAQVRVAAQVAGAGGNVAGGATFSMIPPVTGFQSATAVADFVNGTDTETDDARKQRFSAFIAAISRGPISSFEYILSNGVKIFDASGIEVERISTFYIDEQWERDNSLPRALVDVYIFNGVDGASTALVSLAQKVLVGYVDSSGNKVPGYKAAGVHVNVYAATISHVAVTGSIVVAPGYSYATVAAAAEVAIANYLLDLKVGKTAFPQAIAAAAEAVPGIVSFTPTLPAGPITPALGTKYLAGTFTLTQDTTSTYVL